MQINACPPLTTANLPLLRPLRVGAMHLSGDREDRIFRLVITQAMTELGCLALSRSAWASQFPLEAPRDWEGWGGGGVMSRVSTRPPWVYCMCHFLLRSKKILALSLDPRLSLRLSGLLLMLITVLAISISNTIIN